MLRVLNMYLLSRYLTLKSQELIYEKWYELSTPQDAMKGAASGYAQGMKAGAFERPETGFIYEAEVRAAANTAPQFPK